MKWMWQFSMIMLRLLVQIGIVYDDDLDPLHDSDDGVVSPQLVRSFVDNNDDDDGPLRMYWWRMYDRLDNAL